MIFFKTKRLEVLNIFANIALIVISRVIPILTGFLKIYLRYIFKDDKTLNGMPARDFQTHFLNYGNNMIIAEDQEKHKGAKGKTRITNNHSYRY